MKKLIALLPLLLLGACADPGYSPGAWAGYDPGYDWGYSGYQRPIIPEAYNGPYMGPPPVYPGSAYARRNYYPRNHGPAYSYGPSADYGYGGGHAPPYDGTWYEGPGYGPY